MVNGLKVVFFRSRCRALKRMRKPYKLTVIGTVGCWIVLFLRKCLNHSTETAARVRRLARIVQKLPRMKTSRLRGAAARLLSWTILEAPGRAPPWSPGLQDGGLTSQLSAVRSGVSPRTCGCARSNQNSLFWGKSSQIRQRVWGFFRQGNTVEIDPGAFSFRKLQESVIC